MIILTVTLVWLIFLYVILPTPEEHDNVKLKRICQWVKQLIAICIGVVLCLLLYKGLK